MGLPEMAGGYPGGALSVVEERRYRLGHALVAAHDFHCQDDLEI
jgi:hypothetical protein